VLGRIGESINRFPSKRAKSTRGHGGLGGTLIPENMDTRDEGWIIGQSFTFSDTDTAALPKGKDIISGVKGPLVGDVRPV